MAGKPQSAPKEHKIADNVANQHIEIKDYKATVLYKNAVKLYEHLLSKAEEHTTKSGKIMVYRGYITKEFNDANVNVGFYTPIMKKLKLMNCVEVLESGARNSPSVVALLAHPSAREWPARKSGDPGLTKTRESDTLAQELNDIRQSLGGINLIEALIVVDKRLTALEKKVDALATGGTDAS